MREICNKTMKKKSVEVERMEEWKSGRKSGRRKKIRDRKQTEEVRFILIFTADQEF